MGKKRARQLKKFVKEGIAIADAAAKEIELLKKEVVFYMKENRTLEVKVKELEETEKNLHKKIAELEQNKFLKFGKKITNLLS